MSTDAGSGPVAAPTDSVWVERVGTRTYVGVSNRGDRVGISSPATAGTFTPGELLRIALAACSGLSSDARLSLALGPGYQAVIRAYPTKAEGEERFSGFREVMEVDLGGLDQATRERTKTLALKSIDHNCTIGNTVSHGATVPPLEFTQPPVGPGS